MITNIAICIPFYKNHDVVWRVLYHYAHLDIPNLNITVVAAGSEGDVSKSMAESAGAYYHETVNPTPQQMENLSFKFNANLAASRKFRPDFVMLSGSDDLISAEWLEFGIKQMQEQHLDCVGLMDCFMAHCVTNEVYYWSGYWGDRKGDSLGAGRIVNRKVLNSLNWTLWPEPTKATGHDGRQMQRIVGVGGVAHNYYMHDANCTYFNIKSGKGELHSWEAIKKIHGRVLNESTESIKNTFVDWWKNSDPSPIDQNI